MSEHRCEECGRDEPEHASTCPHATVSNSPALALMHAFSETERLRNLFMNRFKQLLEAKGVEYDTYGDPEIYEVFDNDGGYLFQLKTEHTRCGDTDTTYTTFPVSDLDIDAVELNRRTAERLAAEKAERERKAAEEKIRRDKVQDYEDRKTYERLKAKFGA